jgi:hypothetical protein
MSEVSGRHAAETNETDDTAATEQEAIEAEIERTREDLAATVDLLTARLDVKTRVRHRVARARAGASYRLTSLRDRATDDRGRVRGSVLAAGSAILGAAVVVGSVSWWRHSAQHSRRGLFR